MREELPINQANIKKGISVSIENGGRLFEDSQRMLEWESYPTAYALAVLAQEEYAKALLLSLVDAGALPWTSDVRRALHDHVCKQLVSVILDYLSPDVEEWWQRIDPSNINEKRPIFPSHVVDAIHVICHERIPRVHDRLWLEDSEPLDEKVKKVADGKIDAQKQDSIYVHIGKTGDVLSQPIQVSAEAAKEEVERAERIGHQLRPYNQEPGLQENLDSKKLIALFKLLTGEIAPEEFNSYWWVR